MLEPVSFCVNVNREEDNEWIMTQYGVGVAQNNAMCYSTKSIVKDKGILTVKILNKKFLFTYRQFIIIGVFIICFFQGIISMILPNVPAKYMCDVLLLLSIPFLLTEESYRRQNVFFLWLFMIAFLFVGIISCLINNARIINFLWGFRNYFRLYLFFFLCIYFLGTRELDVCMKLVEGSFYFHMALIFIQYFIFHYKQDLLSGIWGVESGGNGPLNMYLIGLTCYNLYQFHERKITLIKYVLFLLCVCINGALSELKFLFVEIAIITVVYFIISRFSIKNLKMLICIGVILILGVTLLGLVFPFYLDYFSLDNLMSQIFNSQHYSTGQDIGRSAVFSTLTPILQNWGGTDAIFMGIGLGNGDYASAFPILNTPFFMEYEELHYTWLSLGYLFVETGYIGTFLYIMFFISILLMALYRFKMRKVNEYLFTSLFSLACLMILLYNNTLRSNYGYLAFFFLAYAFIKDSCFVNIIRKSEIETNFYKY